MASIRCLVSCLLRTTHASLGFNICNYFLTYILCWSLFNFPLTQCKCSFPSTQFKYLSPVRYNINSPLIPREGASPPAHTYFPHMRQNFVYSIERKLNVGHVRLQKEFCVPFIGLNTKCNIESFLKFQPPAQSKASKFPSSLANPFDCLICLPVYLSVPIIDLVVKSA